MSQVVSFAEESCWDGERFRSVRREIHFVLFGFGTRLKKSLRRDFVADFGLWYDLEDEWLIQILRREEPDIDWGYYVFFKKIDHSAIIVYHPESGEAVATIVPRGRTKRKLSGENGAANVIPISKGVECRERRLAKEEERRKRRCERDRPEGS